jgi:hypothetical protein
MTKRTVRLPVEITLDGKKYAPGAAVSLDAEEADRLEAEFGASSPPSELAQPHPEAAASDNDGDSDGDDDGADADETDGADGADGEEEEPGAPARRKSKTKAK